MLNFFRDAAQRAQLASETRAALDYIDGVQCNIAGTGDMPMENFWHQYVAPSRPHAAQYITQDDLRLFETFLAAGSDVRDDVRHGRCGIVQAVDNPSDFESLGNSSWGVTHHMSGRGMRHEMNMQTMAKATAVCTSFSGWVSNVAKDVVSHYSGSSKPHVAYQ